MTALGRLRTHRRGVVVVASVAVLLVVLSVLSLGSAETGGDLDPDNPRSNGARALARVLARHDVDVEGAKLAALFAASARATGKETRR